MIEFQPADQFYVGHLIISILLSFYVLELAFETCYPGGGKHSSLVTMCLGGQLPNSGWMTRNPEIASISTTKASVQAVYR